MPDKTLISPEYAALNRQLHERDSEYGAHGDYRAEHVVKTARDNKYRSILDFGCGKGSLKPAIASIAPELTVMEYDPAIPGKDALPEGAVDFLVALDVMEHIEPAYLPAVCEVMRDIKPKLAMLQIALTPALKTLPDGRNAHLIVQPPAWWLAQLKPYFETAGTQLHPLHLMYYGIPRS
jgi:2-polyprenyl-3-methyl-5-hydroxy-6-metoxy-1,4-benzoquinol methylase